MKTIGTWLQEHGIQEGSTEEEVMRVYRETFFRKLVSFAGYMGSKDPEGVAITAFGNFFMAYRVDLRFFDEVEARRRMIAITKNEATHAHNRRARLPKHVTADSAAEVAAREDLDADLLDDLNRCLKELEAHEPDLALVLGARYWGRQKLGEIACEQGTSISTIERWSRKAKGLLRRCIEQRQGPSGGQQ